MKHHPKCTCRTCKPPVAEVIRGAHRPPPPAQAPLPGARAVAAPPAAPAAVPPPGPSPAAASDGSVKAMAARARELAAARTRAANDIRMKRYLALRAKGVPRVEALRQVDAEASDERTNR